MAKFRITPASLQKVKANIKTTVAKKQAKIIRAFVVWADDVVGDIRQEYIRVAFDTGELAGSVSRTAPRKTGRGVVRILIFTNKEYASVIEFGRRARSGKPPPLKSLIGWARRKGLVSHLPVNIPSGGDWPKKWGASKIIWERAKKGRKSRRKGNKITDPQIRELVLIRALAASIWRKGIKGRKPMTRIFQSRAKTMKRDIVRLASL